LESPTKTIVLVPWRLPAKHAFGARANASELYGSQLPNVEGPVRSKLDGLENSFNVAATAGDTVLTEIDDLTALVTCAVVPTRSVVDAEAIPTEARRESATVRHATYALAVLILTVSRPWGFQSKVFGTLASQRY
jgi:hypothetical protein